MTSVLRDSFLQRLNGDEAGVADELVAIYEPFLRTVVRRNFPDRLRGKFDSMDVVQSVWVHVLRGLREAGWQFEDASNVRGLLQTMARRRLVSRFRHYSAAAEREQTWAAARERVCGARMPGPDETAEAAELWDRMLAYCPAEHHEVLRLRRGGLSLAEIASRTDMHEGSVRRVLRQLARRLSTNSSACSHPTDSDS